MKKESSALALISILTGVILIILKGDVINILITVIGIGIIISAIMDFAKRLTHTAITKGILGLCVLVFGSLFINLALYILAAALIIMGFLRIESIHSISPVNLTFREKVAIYIKPTLIVVAGVCLLFNQGGVINQVFVVAGVVLIIEGFLEIIVD